MASDIFIQYRMNVRKGFQFLDDYHDMCCTVEAGKKPGFALIKYNIIL